MGCRVMVGVNDLATTHPDIAAQLVDKSLSTILTAGSHRKVMWRCDKGHEWAAAVKSRTLIGAGCPVCSNRLIIAGINDIATTRPDLAAEMVDKELTHKLGAGSSKKVEWECEHGHRWKATIVSRSKMGNGCPVCSNQKVVAGVNDLATTHPDLAAQLVDQSLATKMVAGTDRKVMWRCKRGHEWEASVASRKGGAGCPYCAGNKVIVGETDLATTHPEIAAQAVDQNLVCNLGHGSEQKVEWRCEHGHTWFATPFTRISGVGCPVCANRQVEVGVNDLATVRPDLVEKLADKSLAHELVVGSGRVVRWRCEHGHEWDASVYAVGKGSGCPVCSNQRIDVGVNDLGTLDPELAAQLVNPSEADHLTLGSGRSVEWRCEQGHTWFCTVYDRRRGYGCPVCSGHGSSSAERDFASAVCGLVSDKQVLRNCRSIIKHGELDVVIPDAHFALEFNGLYWHSVEAGKARTYHRDKRLACEAAGYQLMSVWEDTWRDKRDIVLRMIAHKLGVANEKRVFARKLEVREISHSVASGFLSANHIQGFAGATMHIGGFFEDELVAVLSVRDAAMSSRMRYSAGEWEIRRYATSCSVVGGFTKLVAFAERHIRELGLPLARWISLSDCDVSDGHMYEVCGFTLDKELPPDYKYWGTVTRNVRKSKEGFQKHRFRERADLVFEDGLSEIELAKLNGLYRVYDSGKKRWVKDVLP